MVRMLATVHHIRKDDSPVKDDEIRQANLAVMQRYRTLLFAQRFDEWIELWADDGICEFPFAAGDSPKRLEGKAEILGYMTRFPSKFSIEGVDRLQIHPCLDPNTVVAEMAIRGRATGTDKPYNQQYVVVAELRDGKLARYREYWNPLVSAEALT